MSVQRNSEPRLLQALTDAQSAMARLFEFKARHLGLTRPQWRVVAGLHGNNGMTQTELADFTSIARSPLGKIIDQLEHKNFIERRSDPDDRRINRLFLTTAVDPILGPARQLAAELENEVLAGLAATEDPRELVSRLAVRLQMLVSSEVRSF